MPATCCTDIRANLAYYGHTGYNVTNYFRSAFTEVRKMTENAASYGFGSNVRGAAFYLPHQLVSILLFMFPVLTRCLLHASYWKSCHLLLSVTQILSLAFEINTTGIGSVAKMWKEVGRRCY